MIIHYRFLLPMEGNLSNLIESLNTKQNVISRLEKDFEPQFNDRWKNEKVTEDEQKEIKEYLKNRIIETINQIMKR